MRRVPPRHPLLPGWRRGVQIRGATAGLRRGGRNPAWQEAAAESTIVLVFSQLATSTAWIVWPQDPMGAVKFRTASPAALAGRRAPKLG